MRSSSLYLLLVSLATQGCFYSPTGSVPMTASDNGTDDTASSTVLTAGSEPGTLETEGDPSGTGATSSPTTTDPTDTSDPSGTTDGPAACGDSKVDPGEQCDAGAMNGDDQACTAACLLNVCGDGLTGPGEGCDDGNMLPDDGCSPQCTAAGCGDGSQQPGEACDDGNQVDDDGCTNACTLPACGDAIVQVGEQCDAGGESDACNADCSAAACGDGTLNGAAGEQCDDGNKVDTDACVACKTAVCGDGFVQSNVEACDDGNQVDSEVCSNTCELKILRVFVSSVTSTGNLGGLAGADAGCTMLAATAGFKGAWMAWLSDADVGPAKRFQSKGGPRPYVRIDGKVIATNWADLIDGKLAVAININEKGQAPGVTVDVWTNTGPTGSPTGNQHCSAWKAGFGGNGHFGRRDASDAQWTQSADEDCKNAKHLYCFQQ
ncbi:MAG: DUF4215 domain-containing protein [Nannocystis sp.]|nr:DUF4215 domain-containing protein [Nannocystis sp.]MBA3544973.1 DUF4215 domain-containing protein [Nannocystis sp.]